MQKKQQNMQKMNIQKDTNNCSGENYANSCISMITKFHKDISFGAEYICTSCDQLWYKTSVRKCNTSNDIKCQKNLVQSCITGVKSIDNTEWICNTCHLNITEGKLPQCSKVIGMSFPNEPSVLDLTPLEERLILPQILFMQICELLRGGQLSIHGNVVNVPSDVNSTVHTLPRLVSESQTNPIKLKRKLSYKHHYQFQNVRPKKVLEAAKYLVSTSELFKSEGIEVRDAWQNTVTTQVKENDEWDKLLNNDNIEKDSEKDTQTIENNNGKDSSSSINSETNDNDYDDDWCEVDEHPSGVTDTLLQQPQNSKNKMTLQQKSNLIQRDPVTCARNFEHMVQLFVHDVLRSDVMPIGQVTDYFYRIEFQQRGSPHIHGLFWVKGAPQYGKSSEEQIVSFTDKYVTCQKAHTIEMEELVNLQLHRHAKTCKKMGHKVCRFNFPLPPMGQTVILKPLEEYDTFDNEKQKDIKENAEEIKDELDSMKFGEDINFEQFLKKLGLNEESYILALRHTIKRSTFFF